jgi:hypothetical protein
MEEENVPKLDKGVEKKRLISWKLLKEIKNHLLVDILIARSANEGKC